MSSLPKLNRDYVAADLATVEGMLKGLTDEDIVMRIGLEERKAELEAEIAALPKSEEQQAKAGVFFGGRPVVGSTGIETEFGSRAVGMIQELVAKQFAQDADGGLGQRGVVASKGATRLHVTDVLRGSFGFLLEELQPQVQLFDTSLKTALDHVSELLGAFAEVDEQKFEVAIESADARVLSQAREFFSYMNQHGATMRLVAGDADTPFDDAAVARAALRAATTTVADEEEDIVGQLAGVLPERHMFEFRCEGPRGVIYGRIDRALSASGAALMQTEWVNKTAIGLFVVRTIEKEDGTARETFTLKGIRARSTL